MPQCRHLFSLPMLARHEWRAVHAGLRRRHLLQPVAGRAHDGPLPDPVWPRDEPRSQLERRADRAESSGAGQPLRDHEMVAAVGRQHLTG
jgi:hypothetical protein